MKKSFVTFVYEVYAELVEAWLIPKEHKKSPFPLLLPRERGCGGNGLMFSIAKK
jgi:hypothetical protein